MNDGFSQRLQALRKQRKMTLEQVAHIVGVGKSTVRKWETGMIANVRRDKIAALARALNTTPAYLMGWEEDKTATPQISKEAAALIETLSNLPSEKADFANRVLELVNLMLQVPAERFPLLEDLLRVCLKNL